MVQDEIIIGLLRRGAFPLLVGGGRGCGQTGGGTTFGIFGRSIGIRMEIRTIGGLAVVQDWIILRLLQRGACSLHVGGSRSIDGGTWTGGGITFGSFGRSNSVGMDIRTIGRLAVVQDGITLRLFQRGACSLHMGGSRGIDGCT